MAITDFDVYKNLEVTSATGEPTISRALCFKITSGDDTTTGTGEIVLDWTNISSQADIGIYDENDNLLDYYFESFDATNETAVIWVYRDWVRDGSVQAKVAYGNGPSDQSVAASTVFDKESNLKGGWLFNEESGDLLDVTSNNNDGTVYGATQGESGIVGGAYSFDGNDDYVEVSNDSTLNIASSLTLRAKVKLNSTGSGAGIIEKYQVNPSRDKSYLIKEGGSFSFVLSSDGLSDHDTFSTIASNTGQWYDIVCSYDGSEKKIYIDGSLDNSENYSSGIHSSSSTLDIGRWRDAENEYFDGIVDEIRIYNSVLSSNDISTLYAATKSSPDFFSQQEAILSLLSTDSSTNVTSSSATLNGTLSSLEGNSSLDVYFEYGTDTSYGNTTATQTISSVPTSFSADISSLTALTTYHYRAVATDGTNYWYGDDVSFYAADLSDVDETQSEFQNGTLTGVEADSGDYLRLADTDVLSFDGVDDEIDTGLSSINYPFTIEFWIKPDLSNSDQYWRCVGNYSGTSEDIYIWDDDGGTWLFASDVGGTISSGTSVDDATWQHIAWTIDSSGAYAYKDGVQIGSASGASSQTTSPGNTLSLMARGDDASYTAGKFCDFRLWDHARTQTEIQDNMNKRLTGDDPGLVAYYPLDEGTGTTVTDLAGGNDGTINGASWHDEGYIHPFNEDGQGNRVVQLDLSSLTTYSDSLIEWTATFPQVIDSVSLSSEWTQTTNLNVKTDRVYEGDYSVGQDNGYSIDAVLEPDELSGGVQTSSIEFYWQETIDQTGFTVQFVDSSGQTVMEAGGNNPEWELNDGDGSTTLYDGDGYDRWIYYKFEFDWGAGEYTYHLEDLQSGTTRTGTRSLMVSTDIESIKINNSNGDWGDATHIWFDKFVIGGTEANIVDVSYADPTSLTIETRYSLDGGSSWSSWQTCTSGDPIPGLSSGDDLSNALLECRETLSTSDATVTPQLERRAIYLASIEGDIVQFFMFPF